MRNRLLIKKNNANFYLPGEEINVVQKNMFTEWDNKGGGYSCRGRISFGIACCAAAYFIVALRLFGTCVLPNWYEKDVKTYDNSARKEIHRADIVDRNGAIVATSLPTQDLNVNTRNIFSPRNTALKLVEIFPDLKFDDIYKKLKRRNKNFTLKRNLSPHQQSMVIALGDPGLEFVANEKRVYPHKNLMAHVTGTADIDNMGVSGIEKGLNERITQSEIPVMLSLDLGVQDTIRDILYKNMKRYYALSATAILLDVRNGEVVSMVSLPDYNPNDISKNDQSAQFNTATARIYEPGSVLKVFNTAMALESGKVKVTEKFDATQPLKFKYNTVYDYRGENRWLSVEEVLVYSSNIGSAKIALQSGFEEQYNFLKKIRFLEKLDMELVETAKPLVPEKNRWKQSDSKVATIGYGYGISVSPMHIIAAYAAVVNGGIYYSPSVLVNGDNARRGQRILSDNTSKQMRKLMRSVVTEGSGKRANVLGYEVGGKTGTANKLGDDGKYMQKKVRTTFISAFPISDPQYALLVMMDEPKATKETFGFSTAGWNSVPTASEIISAVAPQLNIPANYDLEEKRNTKIIDAAFGR